jgi:hypothetical protein
MGERPVEDERKEQRTMDENTAHNPEHAGEEEYYATSGCWRCYQIIPLEDDELPPLEFALFEYNPEAY